MAQLYATKTITVPSGGTSGYVDIENYDVMGLVIPLLTSSTLKLQVSIDAVTFYDVYDGGGLQTLSWSASTGVRAFSTRDMVDVAGYKYLAVVCGTAQGAQRDCTLMIKSPRRF